MALHIERLTHSCGSPGSLDPHRSQARLPGAASQHNANLTTSSSAPAPPAACWRTRLTASGAIGCCCSRPAAATGASGFGCRSATASPSTIPRVNWMYRTEPDPALGGREGYWPRGKVLGGSSAINAMVLRPRAASDFDDWAARGNPGWGWDDVLPVLQAPRDECRGADAWRGDGGPLHVPTSPPTAPAVRGLSARGSRARARPNDPTSTAPPGRRRPLPDHHASGLRMSAARAYLRPAAQRRTCASITNAHVDRILFEGARATGVEYRAATALQTARAGREVILAAGAIRFAAAAAALRRRPGGAAEVARHRGAARHAGGRPQPAGSSLHRPPLPLARTDAERGARTWLRPAPRRPALSVCAARPAGAQRQPGRRFRSHAAGARRARTSSSTSRRSATPARRPGMRPLMRPGPVPRISAQRAALPPDQPRLPCISARPDPLAAAGDRAEFAGHRGGSARPAGGVALPAQARGRAGAAGIIDEEMQPGRRCSPTRNSCATFGSRRRHGVPSGRHLPHGTRPARRGRPTAAGAWPRRPARGRRLGLPGRDLGQHQRAGAHGGGEGGDTDTEDAPRSTA